MFTINKNTRAIDSREVAEMTGKRHSDLLETISGYIKHLENGKFRSPDFFIESTYISNQNKVMPCYLVTRKGCEMIANKMTGEKGVLFTATFINRFHEMEQSLITPLPASCSMSLSGLASYIHEIRKTMEGCHISPFVIAASVKGICDSCGVASFAPILVPSNYEQLSLFIPSQGATNE